MMNKRKAFDLPSQHVVHTLCVPVARARVLLNVAPLIHHVWRGPLCLIFLVLLNFLNLNIVLAILNDLANDRPRHRSGDS